MANNSLMQNTHIFGSNPTALHNVQRSKFDLSHDVKTTFNVGELVPFDVIEVLPGDTFNIQTNTLARLQTLITPLMDDLYLDYFYFFVPNRLVWEHWKEFMGENTKSKWYSSTTYTLPTIDIDSNADLSKSILDYMGVPTNTSDVAVGTSIKVNALPVRAYNLIYNEWFRDQNLQDPLLVSIDDSSISFDPDDPTTGGKLNMANKYHDYFTSCLPSPQKGPDVSIPLFNESILPVIPTTANNWEYIEAFRSEGLLEPLRFGNADGTEDNPNLGTFNGNNYHMSVHSYGPAVPGVANAHDVTPGGEGFKFIPTNLSTIVSPTAVQSINNLRLAFATQQLYELDARGGTRYVEILLSHFGVVSPDARQQRPELLSYNHLPISVQQVVQQSATAQTSPLGNVAGLSVTADSEQSFVKSFTEHGYIIGLCTARYRHSYQQGLNRLWSRSTRFDFYWPVFANIGEQPVLNKEIFVDYSKKIDDSTNKNDEVFGYQEAWAEYRYIPNRVSAEMRSDYKQSLDVWHLADDYQSMPFLSSDWISENPTTVNRVLAVSDNLACQIFCDLYIYCEATRPMPVYSIPGLTKM